MSLFEDIDKDRPNLFRAPPIRKLFSSQTMEESRHDSGTFQVFVRIKPISDDLTKTNTIKIVDSSKLICKPPSQSKVHKAECVEYTFSRIFPANATQPDIFEKCVVPCLKDLTNCQSSLIFTYGTTNAGKTYTIQGHLTNPGIIPRTLFSLFNNIRPDKKALYIPSLAKDCSKLSRQESEEEINITEEMIRSSVGNFKACKDMSYFDVLNDEYHDLNDILNHHFVELETDFPTCTVWISFIELYNEIIFDLLECSGNRKPLKLSTDKHNNFYVRDLKHIFVRTFEEAYTIYRIGRKNLNVACTKMNENSSRSHCIFTIKLINHEYRVMSTLSICDLAGTERQTKTQNHGMRLKESGTINTSLFQLNRCLRTLRENQIRNTSQLVPFRQSKLTKLFHSVFNEKSDEKIVMIVNINPSGELYDETQQVLKMCAIASKIKNKPIMSKILRQSVRFTSYVYGKDSSSLLDEDQYENCYSEVDEDSSEVQCEEIQQLKDQLALKDQDLKRTMERCEGFDKLYKRSQNMLSEYMATVEKNNAEMEAWYYRKMQFYVDQIKLLKKEANSSYSNDDLRKEILEKDFEIEELKEKLEKFENRQCLNTVHLDEIYEKNKKIDELESLLTEGKTAYKTVVDQLTSMSEKLNTVESRLQEKTELAEALEINLSQKQVIIEDLEARIENLEETLCENAIEHELILSDLEKQRNEIKHKLELSEELLATIKEEKKVMEEEHRKLTNDLDSMKATVREQKELMSILEKERDEAISKLGDSMKTIEELERVAAEKQLEHESEIKILQERIIALDEATVARNNRTPLKQLGKENKTPSNNNASSKGRKTRQQTKILKPDIIIDSEESEVVRFFESDPITSVGKKSTVGRKKKLFSSPATPGSVNLISFESAEKDKQKYLDCGGNQKSEVTTPAQTVKALKKKR